MNPEQSPPNEKTSLLTQPESGFSNISSSGSPALSEIMSRSLVHIQTGRILTTRHRIGDCELCDPDFRLVCAWAEELQSQPENVLKRLLNEPKQQNKNQFGTQISNGKFRSLFVDGEVLNISGFQSVGGLVLENLCLFGVKHDFEFRFSAIPSLKVFDCRSNQMTKLDLCGAGNLTVLNCGWNDLTGLDLSVVPNLVELYCADNSISSVALSEVPKLIILDCESNLELAELDLFAVPNLTSLSCACNRLTNLDLLAVPKLVKLSCAYNLLANLDLSEVPNLHQLSCGCNNMTSLDLSAVPNLTELKCWSNQLTEIDLSTVPNLTELWCWGNNIKELDIRPLRNLKTLRFDEDVCLIQRPDQNFK